MAHKSGNSTVQTNGSKSSPCHGVSGEVPALYSGGGGVHSSNPWDTDYVQGC
jgi:hypothetical protein